MDTAVSLLSDFVACVGGCILFVAVLFGFGFLLFVYGRKQ